MTITKEQLRQGYVSWFNNYDWRYFVTLTFEKKISKSKAEKRVEQFLVKLNKLVYGGRSKKKLYTLPFIEKHSCNENYHLHFLIHNEPSLPIDKLKSKIRLAWLRDVNEFRRQEKQRKSNKPTAISKSNFIAYEGDPYTTDVNKTEWFKHIFDIDELVRYCTKQLDIHTGSDPFLVMCVKKLPSNT